jgi:hypothetical protein
LAQMLWYVVNSDGLGPEGVPTRGIANWAGSAAHSNKDRHRLKVLDSGPRDHLSEIDRMGVV